MELQSSKEKEHQTHENGWLNWLKQTKLTEIEFLLFGFAMMMGNRNLGWNAGLAYGYGSLLFNLLYAGCGYICLCLCMGEMSSALPFSGGIFGFVRAALGPFNGFLVASCEFVYCTTYIVVKVHNLNNIPLDSGYFDTHDIVGMIVAVYAVCLGFSLIGGKPVFALTSLIGFFTCVVLMIYLFGTLSKVGSESVSLSRYGGPQIDLSWANVMGARLSAGAQYNGMQYFPLLSGLLKEPREQVPRMLLITCSVFIVLSVVVTLAAVSQAPGGNELVSEELPLKYGFARILDMNVHAVEWLELPCLFGSVFGLFYCSGKQLLAITKSGLLPSFLDKTIPGLETPYLCYTLAAVLGAGLNIFALSSPKYLTEIRAISLMSSFYVFTLCFVAYMVFRRKFSSMSRSFVNPLGDYAAVFGIINYVSAGIGLIFYSSIDPIFLAGFGGYLLGATVFFWTYLVKYQKFSEEEKKLMFKAYLINANRNMRQKGKVKNNKVAPASNCKSNTHSSLQASQVRNTTDGVTSPPSCHLPDTERNKSVSFPPETSEQFIETQNPNPEPFRSFSSGSTRPTETVQSLENTRQSIHFSEKLLKFISSKMNSVAPLRTSIMDPNDLQDYEQLAALSSGGVLDQATEDVLQARFGMDVESREVEGVDECVEV